MRISVVLTLLFVGFISGCYAHRPVAFTSTAPGEMVRVHFTEEGTAQLAQTFGVRQRQVQGEVLATGADHILLGLTLPPPMGSRGTQTSQREFRISPTHVSELELRELDQRRTAAFLLGGGLAISLAFYLVKVTDSGGPLPGPGGPGDFIRIPLGGRP